MAPPAAAAVRARWVLPIDGPPLGDGWVRAADGQITAVGQGPPPRGDGASFRDLGDVAVLPGLVNAHTHLELSHLHGQIPPAPSMPEWIRAMLAARIRAAARPDLVREAAVRAAAGMRDNGIVLVGDISNSLASIAVLAGIGLGGVVFHEVLGFNAADPEALVRDAWAKADRALADAAPRVPLAVSVVPHAPYSVSPALFATIAAARRAAPLSVHLAESAEELAFLRDGTGGFRDLLEDLGSWTSTWTPPRLDPAAYLDDLGCLVPGLLVVHGVHVTDAALDRLRTAGATLVVCPRSNAWVGAGLPPIARFYGSGVPVAIGTDSLSSSPSLSVFDELAELRRIAPEVSAASLLESATRVGAEALGLGAAFGTLAAGKRAALVAVDVPPGIADVEEYLVGGVPPDAIHPLTL
jgi:cytosine/adenosine deaminase-related metal-dependent hydrolase